MSTNQIRYRGRNDNGSETTATFQAALNTPWVQTPDTNFRVRFQIQNDTSAVSNLDVQLQYQVNSTAGAWTNVGAASNVVRSSASANLADAANLTQQLGAGTGTFIGATCFDEVNGICGGTALDVVANGYFEVEFCCQLRSADVTTSDTIYLRTINSDTGTGWSTYTVIAQLTEASPDIAKDVPDDDWGTLADTAALTERRRPAGWIDDVDYNRVSLGAVLIPVNVGADSLGLYADQTPQIDRRGILSVAPAADSLGLYADQTPVIDKRGTLTVSVPADSLGLYSDAAPTISKIGFLTAAPGADSLGLYADQTPLFDLSLIATPITVNVPADSLGLYADQTPLTDKRGYLTAAPATDSLGLYGDQTPLIDERGTLSAAPGADSLGLYADQTPVIDERGTLTVAPAADSLGLYSDAAPTVIKIVFLTASPGADSLGLYADQTPVFDKPVISTTPITANVPADSLGLYADQAPATDKRGILSAAPAADSLGLYADQTPAIDERGFISVTPPADDLANYAERLGLGLSLRDDLNLWADARDASTTGQVPKTYNVPADDLENYTERLGLGVGLIGDLMTMADQPAAFIETGALTVSASDSLGLYADQAPPAILKTAQLTAAPAADANVAYGERLGRGVGLTDDLENYAEGLGLGVSLRDNLAAYDDQVQISTGAGYQLTFSDSLQLWADTPAVNYAKRYAVPTDAMAMGDQPAAHAIGRFYPLTDAMPAYGELFGFGIGLIDNAPDYFDAAAAAEFGFLRVSVLDDNEDYNDALNILFLGFDQLGLQFTDTLANWDDAAAVLSIIYALRLNGRVSSGVALNGKVTEDSLLTGKAIEEPAPVTGKVIEEQILINGRVREQISLTGEVYEGEL